MKNLLSKPLNIIIIVIVGLAIILAVIFGIKNANDQASLKKADEIAVPHQANIDIYKKAANAEIQAKSASVNSEQTAKEFADVVDAKIKAIPELQSVGRYGEKHSNVYQKAVNSRDQLKKSYESLALYARGELASSYKYLATIQGMLNMKVSDYLGNVQVVDGSPVREKLIPPYQAAYDSFAKLTVPEGQGELAKNTRNTFMSFITSAQDAAKKLDSHESFSFDFSKEFADLQNQVNAAGATLHSTFEEKVKQATK
jgi:hypothetical protein